MFATRIAFDLGAHDTADARRTDLRAALAARDDDLRIAAGRSNDTSNPAGCLYAPKATEPTGPRR